MTNVMISTTSQHNMVYIYSKHLKELLTQP